MTQLGFNTTRLVHDLCAVLESLQIPFQTGVSEATGLLRIDIALPDQQVCQLHTGSSQTGFAAAQGCLCLPFAIYSVHVRHAPS